MKLWAPTTFTYYHASDLFDAKLLPENYDLIIIDDSECNGEITASSYHDGSAIFTRKVLMNAFHQLVATHTRHIGTIRLRSDFVFCDMAWGKNVMVQRDVVTIRFKYEALKDEDDGGEKVNR